MDNLISRQAAIDAVSKGCLELRGVFKRCEDNLLSLPSAQPERKRGKWVRYDGDWLKTMCKCSECGAMIDINEQYINFFCYHCGAYMREESNNE